MLGKLYFIGAGPGDPELITVKGKRIISEADVIIYAGSRVNPEVLNCRKNDAVVYNSRSCSYRRSGYLWCDSGTDGWSPCCRHQRRTV